MKCQVYIECDENSATIHATNAIKSWGYWWATENKDEADFILKFNIVFGGLMDMNTKRGVINKIVNKEIKAIFY